MTTIKEKILFLRKHGVKVGEIADEIGVSRQFLQQMVSGKSKVPYDKMTSIDNLIVKLTGDINAQGATVNGGVIGHGGTVGTPPQSETDFQLEIRNRLANLERLIVDLLARSSNGV